jgi:cytoskeletal protein CcmA (bactofilin family)
MGSDHFVFGGAVRVDQPVAGDLITAGGNIDLEAEVKGDAVAAGGHLRIAAPVGQNVYAAGGRVVIDAAVGRNVRAAGGQVDLGPKAVVAGNVTVAGGQVSLRGAVKGAVSANGGRVTIDGPVDGDVDSNAGSLRLGPNARIGGLLRYRSGDEIVLDPAAQVAGGVQRLALPGRSASASAGAGALEGRRERSRWLGPGWFWTLGLMALAAALVAAMPASSRRAGEVWRTRFGWSLLWGFVALVCIPVAVLILLISIVGIPIALLAILLYGALLIVGYAASGIALGQWGLVRWRADMLDRKAWRIGSAVAALLVLALLGRVPFVGGFVALLAVITGIGSIAQLLMPSKTGPVQPA